MGWAGKLVKPYRITDGKGFRLKEFDPGDTRGLASKAEAEELLSKGIAHLVELQTKLYAQDRWALLLIFQAMDAAGKDSAIKHVMSGINPQGCQVYSFKAPSQEELDHDYMWRTSVRLPERGRIGIFNRSYYEEVLILRVHPNLLAAEKVPLSQVNRSIWKERYEDIRGFERYLWRNGTVVRKFFLNVSRKEQKKRFLERLDDPQKNWKFSAADVKEREYWDDYMRAYEEMVRHTASKHAPWYVVPGDHKWFTRAVVAAVVVDALQDLELSYPRIDPAGRKQLEAARRALERSGK
ncbi:MAG TPA: polyphosphate kinase 2 family protein [Terriglobales bacterium]|jgi:PPK2 family polyphosphate:nucleotide phosphotransferase